MFGIFNVVTREWVDRTPRWYEDAATERDRLADGALRVWPVGTDDNGRIVPAEAEGGETLA